MKRKFKNILELNSGFKPDLNQKRFKTTSFNDTMNTLFLKDFIMKLTIRKRLWLIVRKTIL